MEPRQATPKRSIEATSVLQRREKSPGKRRWELQENLEETEITVLQGRAEARQAAPKAHQDQAIQCGQVQPQIEPAAEGSNAEKADEGLQGEQA